MAFLKERDRRTQEAVVEVEPANLGANVEGAPNGVDLELGSRDLCAVGDDGALDNRTHELRAFWESKALETAAKRVEEAETGRVERLGRVDLVCV
jgi:hypothetical protein